MSLVTIEHVLGCLSIGPYDCECPMYRETVDPDSGAITKVKVDRNSGTSRDPAEELVDVADRAAPVFMSTDAKTRKLTPVGTGVFGYFPDSLACVSIVSRVGNDQHNGVGSPLRWAKEKSSDELDALSRHLLDHLKKAPVDELLLAAGLTQETAHLAQAAWRALAALQRACDAERKKFTEG